MSEMRRPIILLNPTESLGVWKNIGSARCAGAGRGEGREGVEGIDPLLIVVSGRLRLSSSQPQDGQAASSDSDEHQGARFRDRRRLRVDRETV